MGKAKPVKSRRKANAEPVFTTHFIEFHYGNELKNISYKDISRDPFAFPLISEHELKMWIELHPNECKNLLEECLEVETIMDILHAIKGTFENDLYIPVDDLEKYSGFSMIDYDIIEKLSKLGLINKGDEVWEFKAKNKANRPFNIALTNELYNLLCDDKTQNITRQYIDKIKTYDYRKKSNSEGNIILWIMDYIWWKWREENNITDDDFETLPF